MTDVELVKSKLDIVEVVESYVNDLKKAGSNYTARCPFHNEKTPSFHVNPSLQIYKCFGCGKAGDVIEFIREIEKVQFPDALKIAAEKAGVQLSGNFEGNKKNQEETKKIIEANTLAAKFFHYLFQTHKTGESARKYAQKRQIDAERVEKFMIGFAPASNESLKNFLVSKGFDSKDLIKWGLLVERSGKMVDKFKQRLMQPIFNLKGEIVGFSGRYIGTSKDAPKYLNSPETLVYKKNEMLYGMYQAKEFINSNRNKDGASFLIIVEGNIDILSSHRVGVGNIVAPLGTAFTLNQGKIIKRFADELYFCFDTDSAGMKALVRGLSIAEELELKHKVIDITGFQDADELICKEPEEWAKRIENPKNTIEYLIEKYSQDLDLGGADGKVKFNARIIPILKLLKDEVTLNHFVREVAVMLGISEESIFQKIRKQTSDIRYQASDDNKDTTQSSRPKAQSSEAWESPTRKLEIYLLSLLLQSNHLFSVALKDSYFQDYLCKEIYEQLLAAGEDADFGEVADKLSGDCKEMFEDIVMFDSSRIKNMNKEIKTVLDRVYENYLKQEILKLRKFSQENTDDDSITQRLKELTMELKGIGKKR